MAADRPGEFDLIARFFAPLAGPEGLGLLDDAALLTPPPGCDLVLSKDMLVADVHFFADDPPATIAKKALRVNLSDLAAKGARPLGFLLGLGLPWGWDESWLSAFAAGLAEDVSRCSCPLFGGDTVAARERLLLSVTVVGAVPAGAMVRRSGGRAGDRLYVTGCIGDAALGLEARAAQRAEDRLWPGAVALIDRYLVPQPRLALAEAVRRHASAAMDVSDGLVGDASKLAVASGTGLTLRLGDVPLSDAARQAIADRPDRFATAMTGGDDYELLCAIPPDGAARFEAAAAAAGVPVTAIGELSPAGDAVVVLDASGLPFNAAQGSFRHF